MSQRFFKPNRPIMLVTALALLCGVRTSHAQISVRVNDSMVRFDRVGPMQIGGSVFIPLRAVGDSLGVDLHWEEATQTITGKKSPHVFVLKLGSKYASVDDQSVTLSSPARTVNGVTMVPLRFVAEALGAEVRWRPELSMVTITTDAPMPTTPPVPIVTTLKGEVVGVQSKGNSPSITIRTSQGRTRFDITRDTVVMRGLSGDRGSPSDLDQVVLGNSVEIKPDPSGSIALSIKELVAPPAPSTRVVGDIISVQQKSDPPTISVNTSTGRVRLEITPDTIILSGPVGSRGVQTDLDRLALGSKVEIRTDAAGAVAISIRENLPVPVAAALPVKTAPPIMKAGISSFQITRAAIIRAGSQVNVNMVGTPGGTATFSVGD
ncbi:MAG: copper amine oxidase N-terminal domain-containing protein, partial [Chthonomonadales bacterium]